MRLGKLATLRVVGGAEPEDARGGRASQRDAGHRNIATAAFAKYQILVSCCCLQTSIRCDFWQVAPKDSFDLVMKRLHGWRRSWRSVMHK